MENVYKDLKIEAIDENGNVIDGVWTFTIPNVPGNVAEVFVDSIKAWIESGTNGGFLDPSADPSVRQIKITWGGCYTARFNPYPFFNR